jgi:hypothetical protein
MGRRGVGESTGELRRSCFVAGIRIADVCGVASPGGYSNVSDVFLRIAKSFWSPSTYKLSKLAPGQLSAKKPRVALVELRPQSDYCFDCNIF